MVVKILTGLILRNKLNLHTLKIKYIENINLLLFLNFINKFKKGKKYKIKIFVKNWRLQEKR